MKLRLIAIFLVAALAAGCSDSPGRQGKYSMSVRDVFEKLHVADFKEFRNDRQCGILIHIKRDAVDYKSLTWRVTSSGVEMLNFTARLVPIDAEHTEIVVEVSKEKNGREAYDGSQNYARPAVLQPVRPAITEQIDAILNDRPFKWQNVRAASAPKDSFGTVSSVVTDRTCKIQRGSLTGLSKPFSIHDVKENLLK